MKLKPGQLDDFITDMEHVQKANSEVLEVEPRVARAFNEALDAAKTKYENVIEQTPNHPKRR